MTRAALNGYWVLPIRGRGIYVFILLCVFQVLGFGQTSISTTITSSRCPNNGRITITVSNGTGPFVYELISGPGTPYLQNSTDSTYTFSSLAAGSYVVRVTDQVPTLLTDTVVVTGNYSVPVLGFTSTGTTCPNDSTGSFTIHITGGLQPMTYQISAPSAFATGWLNDSVFTGLPANTYTVGVTDSCGTIQTSTVSIGSSYDNFEPEATFTLVSCDSIQWSVTVPEHGAPPFSYQMTVPFSIGPQSNGLFTVPDSFANYIFQVTDACGITEVVSDSIAQSLNVATTPISCDSAILTASTTNFYGNAIEYIVISGMDTLLNGASTVNLTIGAGTYNVYAYNECGDTLFQTFIYTPAAIAIANVDTDISECHLGMGRASVSINSSGGLVTFAFLSGPSGFPLPDPILTSNAEVTYDSLLPGMYVYYVTDTCGRSDTLAFNIEDSLEISLSVTHIPGCSAGDEAIEANITSNIDPDWLYSIVELDSNGTPLGNFSSSNTSGEFDNLTGGIYVIRARSEDCPGIFYYDTVSFSSYTALSILALEGLVCGDSSLTMIASADGGVIPYTYEIIQGPVLVGPQSNPIFSNLPYGTTYRVRVADSCGNAIVQDISPSPLNVLAPNLQDTIICIGGSYSVDVVTLGGVTYEWLDNASNPTSQLDIQNATLADSGTYVLTIAIAGCDTLIDTAHVTIIAAPIADAGTDTNGICYSADSVCRQMDAAPLLIGETGVWSIITQPAGYHIEVADSTDPVSMVIGDEGVSYEMVWTVDNGYCQRSDTVILNFVCNIFLGPEEIHVSLIDEDPPSLSVWLEHSEYFQHLELQQEVKGENRFQTVAYCLPPLEMEHRCDGIPLEGEFYYRVRGLTYSGDYVLSNVVGTGKLKEDVGQAFPNPATTSISVQVNQSAGVYPLVVTVFNVHGQQVQQHSPDTNCFGLDVSSLPGGVYLIVVSTQSGSILLKKEVVVTHPH